MRRTQIGSEPADREYLDLLFRQGRESRSWADDKASNELGSFGGLDGQSPTVWTIPIVLDGLAVGSRIFAQSFRKKLLELVESFDEMQYFNRNSADADISDTHFEVSEGTAFGGGERFAIRCQASGVISSAWSQRSDDQVGGGDHNLARLVGGALPLHKLLLSEVFEYEGWVLLAQANRWQRGPSSPVLESVLLTYPEPALVDDLDSKELADALQRQVTRHLGYWANEP
jgi:hypothetical protein